METGKPGLASAPAHNNLVTAQMERRMEIQTPLMALYIPTVSALPALPGTPYPQPPAAPPPAASERTTLHLAVPPARSKDALPFVTLHFTGSLQPQRGSSLPAASPAPRPKSAGKHVCPHCGRDCLKPSVLEKHLRCHTGERPFPCTTCGISFKTQSNLYKHKRTQAHARLSSESDQSLPSSLDSMSSSRETCSSSMSLDEHPVDLDTDVALTKTRFDGTPGVCFTESDQTVGKDNRSISTNHQTEEPSWRTDVSQPLHRHVPLQRQEATLFSKQWESSVSKGKSQSHESTDSGFSESGDLYQSPASVLPDHSKDGLAESTMEHPEETATKASPIKEASEEAKATARQQDKISLEKRISKLISENSAVVEDKQLENVRPRKTVLSKQGSIDLPMPYVYKDSFHFDMRLSKTPGVGLQRSRKPDFYSSVPTQQSTTTPPGHAPLTRSHSLPYSVALLQPEKKSQSLSQSDYATLVRRGSSGQINPAGFAVKCANQQSSTHRPLVRQAAVDCIHATDSLCMNSSAEEAGTGTLCCDGDGSEICGEPGNRKFRRRKAQKFAYNKWYMYGGGTFKKLYSTEAGGKESGIKGKKVLTNPDQGELVQGLQKQAPGVLQKPVTTPDPTVRFTGSSAPQNDSPAKLSLATTLDFNLKTTQVYTSCSSFRNPFRKNLSLSALPLPINESVRPGNSAGTSTAGAERLTSENTPPDSSSTLCESQVPSDSKKQRTEEKLGSPSEMETDQVPIAPPSLNAASCALYPPATTYANHPKNLTPTVIPCKVSSQSVTVGARCLTSTPSATKTSFLPKYQLKLPNSAELDSILPLNITDKASISFSASSSPSTETTSLSPPIMQRCTESKKTSATLSTQSYPSLSRTATTPCKAEAASLVDVLQRQPSAAISTTSRTENWVQLRCTSARPSKREVSSAPAHLPGCAASVVVNVPDTTSVTTGSDQPDCCLLTPNSLTRLSPSSPISGSSNTCVHTSAASSHSLHCDQKLLPAQSVVHLRTGDLQIWLQIISDEQLALIQPQIERQADSNFSQRPRTEAPQSSQGSPPSSQPTMRSSHEVGNHQQPVGHKDLDKSNSASPVLKRLTTSLTVQAKDPGPNMFPAESDYSKHTTTTAESPNAHGQSQSRTCGHANMATEIQKSVMDVVTSAASQECSLSFGRSQTSMEGQAPCQKHRAARLEDMDGVRPQTSSIQQNPSAKCPAVNMPNQSSSIRVQDTVAHHTQVKNPGPICHFAMTEVKSSKSLGGVNPPVLPVGLQQMAGTTSVTKQSSSSRPISKYRAARQLKPQESIYSSDSNDCVSSQTHNSSEYSKTGGNAGSPALAPPPNKLFQREPRDPVNETQNKSTVNDSQLSPLPLQSQLGKSTTVLAGSTSSQSPTAGVAEGDFPAGFRAQEKTQTQEQRATLKRRNLQQSEDQRSGALAGEGQSKGLRRSEQPGLQSLKGSEVDPSRPEPPLPHPSLTRSQVSPFPHHGPQQGTSSSLCSPSSCASLAPQSTPMFRPCDVHRAVKTQAQQGASQSSFSLIKSRPQKTSVHHQKQDELTGTAASALPPLQRPESSAVASPSCHQTSGAHPGRAAATSAAEPPTFADILDSSGTCPQENVDYDNAAKDSAALRDAGESGGCGPMYSSFFFLGQTQDFPAAEGHAGGMRPVQGCQEDTGDGSSSDDEGKLIIEL